MPPYGHSHRLNIPDKRTLLCALLIAFGVTPACLATDQHYEGIAYASDGARMLYKEEHFLFDDHGVPSRLVLYRCPSGQPFARKWDHDVAGADAPDFDLIDARMGYREGVRGTGGHRVVYIQADSRAKMRSAALPDRPGTVIDAGFDAYVREHWSDFDSAQKAHIAFVVPSQLGSVPLRVNNADTHVQNGEPVRHLRLSMDAWYGFAVPSIDLTYEAADRRLLRFQGLSNIHDVAGKNQSVRIEFPRSGVLAVPSREDIDRAATLPLSESCPI